MYHLDYNVSYFVLLAKFSCTNFTVQILYMAYTRPKQGQKINFTGLWVTIIVCTLNNFSKIISNLDFRLPIITNSLKAKVTFRTKMFQLSRMAQHVKVRLQHVHPFPFKRMYQNWGNNFHVPSGQTYVYIAPSFHLICAIFLSIGAIM